MLLTVMKTSTLSSSYHPLFLSVEIPGRTPPTSFTFSSPPIPFLFSIPASFLCDCALGALILSCFFLLWACIRRPCCPWSYSRRPSSGLGRKSVLGWLIIGFLVRCIFFLFALRFFLLGIIVVPVAVHLLVQILNSEALAGRRPASSYSAAASTPAAAAASSAAPTTHPVLRLDVVHAHSTIAVINSSVVITTRTRIRMEGRTRFQIQPPAQSAPFSATSTTGPPVAIRIPILPAAFPLFPARREVLTFSLACRGLKISQNSKELVRNSCRKA